MIQLRVSEADEQLGMVKEALNSDGILEVSLSDDEFTSSASSPSPSHTSDLLSPDEDSNMESAGSGDEVDTLPTSSNGQTSGTFAKEIFNNTR
jgi:hypothetical protein